MMDKNFVEILVCPSCKIKVLPDHDRLVCQNPGCGLRYPVRDEIPVMLIDEAEQPRREAPRNL